MKFWLTCFGLLFVGAELLQWVAELGSGQPDSVWLVLGGLGLAAVSNASHLPKLVSKAKADAVATDETDISEAKKNQSSEALRGDRAQNEPTLTQQKPLSVAQQSSEDSISFKVRLPWR